jgi:hypothetical protein
VDVCGSPHRVCSVAAAVAETQPDEVDATTERSFEPPLLVRRLDHE